MTPLDPRADMDRERLQEATQGMAPALRDAFIVTMLVNEEAMRRLAEL